MNTGENAARRIMNPQRFGAFFAPDYWFSGSWELARREMNREGKGCSAITDRHRPAIAGSSFASFDLNEQ
jgi:hypothetical protein